MTVGSLFSGIGGLDLGLERAGHTVQWQIEADPYCRRVLAQHWPHVPCHHDIKTVTAGDLTPVDLLCGGFPCQPVSHAGLQKGTTDDRWLWPEFYRLIDVLRPRYVLLENVPGLLTANGGSAFRGILADLATSGYDAEWDCLPAAAVGAPHLRYRVFIIASLPDAERHRAGVQSRHAPSGGQAWEPPHASKPTLVRPEDRKADAERLAPSRQAVADAQEFDQRTRLCPSEPTAQRRGRSGDSSGTLADQPTAVADSTSNGRGSRGTACSGLGGWPAPERPSSQVADADRAGREELRGAESVGSQFRSAERGGAAMADADHQRCVGGRQPEQHDQQGPRWREPDGRLSDGRFFDAPISGEWPIEPSMGRLADGVPDRVAQLKALGNAVVPQVAEWLGRRLQEHLNER